MVNREDDTLQNDQSQNSVGGNALSQRVAGNDDMGSETESENEESELGGKLKELLYNAED